MEVMDKPRQFPKSVPFIIFYALCERYSSMGVAGKLREKIIKKNLKEIFLKI
jgi:hypothetical protein